MVRLTFYYFILLDAGMYSCDEFRRLDWLDLIASTKVFSWGLCELEFSCLYMGNLRNSWLYEYKCRAAETKSKYQDTLQRMSQYITYDGLED